jgi:hypothetical protein
MVCLGYLLFPIEVELGSVVAKGHAFEEKVCAHTVSRFVAPSLAMVSAASFPVTLQWDGVQTDKNSYPIWHRLCAVRIACLAGSELCIFCSREQIAAELSRHT